MVEEWSEWFEHDGSERCPFSLGDRVQTYGGYGGRFEYDEWTVDAFAMGITGYRFIIRYRIRKPRGLTILQDLIEQMPETVEA